MYFWEHQSNARYWRDHKKRARESAIVSAEINLEQLLDLTDDDICSELNRYYERLKDIGVTKPLGKKLDYIFEAFQLSYTVIKGREHKEKKVESPFLARTHITTKSVDIYCVKDVKAIGIKEWVLV